MNNKILILVWRRSYVTFTIPCIFESSEYYMITKFLTVLLVIIRRGPPLTGWAIFFTDKIKANSIPSTILPRKRDSMKVKKDRKRLRSLHWRDPQNSIMLHETSYRLSSYQTFSFIASMKCIATPSTKETSLCAST